MKERDFLDEDPKIAGQNFACVSFVSPSSNQKSDVLGLKIRGVFETREEAEKRVRFLQDYDSDFDIYVADLFRWLPWAPDPEKIQDEVHMNSQLNELVKGQKQSNQQAKSQFKKRTNDLLEKAMEEANPETTNVREFPLSVRKRFDDLTEQIKDLKEQLSNAEKKLETTQATLNEITPAEMQHAEYMHNDHQRKLKEADGPESLNKLEMSYREVLSEYSKGNGSLEELYPKSETETVSEHAAVFESTLGEKKLEN